MSEIAIMTLSKKYPLLICVLLLVTFLNATPSQQFTYSPHKSDTIPGEDTNSLKIFEKVDIEAAFEGGEQGWRTFLEQNLNANTPVDKGAPAGSYTVWVQFIVDKEGKISDIKALTRNGYGMENEVMRIIRKSPLWSPAEQNGRKVKAYRKQPVTFVVQEEKKKEETGIKIKLFISFTNRYSSVSAVDSYITVNLTMRKFTALLTLPLFFYLSLDAQLPANLKYKDLIFEDVIIAKKYFLCHQ